MYLLVMIILLCAFEVLDLLDRAAVANTSVGIFCCFKGAIPLANHECYMDFSSICVTLRQIISLAH